MGMPTAGKFEVEPWDAMAFAGISPLQIPEGLSRDGSNAQQRWLYCCARRTA